MEKILKLILTILFINTFSFKALSEEKKYPRLEYMQIEQAEKKWGVTPFDVRKFKEGSESTRASMVVNMIQKKYYIGKPLKQVRAELGTHDGYIVNDAIPAYIITPKVPKGQKITEVWQVVFLPDENWTNTKEVKIHKNCCYK